MRVAIKYLVKLGKREYNNEYIMKTTYETLVKDVENFKETIESLAWNSIQGDEDYKVTILNVSKIDKK